MSDSFLRAEALFQQGNQLMAAGDDAAALQCFSEALVWEPELAEAHANLGFLQAKAGCLPEAEQSYRRALALLPQNLQIHLNLGALLMESKRFDESEAIYRQALAFAPQSAPLWSNLGVLLACCKREEEAERCYRTALALDPDYGKARFNLSYVLLRQGHFDEGWRCLEAREWYGALSRHFTFPRWQGEELAGKTVVIGFEAGHGDMIQFCRYATSLKTMGAARVSIICHPGLKTLFATLADVDEVLSFQDAIPPSGWDYWTPPLSLPGLCHTRLDNIPAALPYLAADPAKASQWRQCLTGSGKHVGLVWKGNPLFENDADRSLPSLDWLAPLSSVAGIQFVSLQKGAGEDEALRPPAGLNILPLGAELQDFADTAALISALDLVISVDTAVAHLAGALGKPCWLLLPDYRTDWRWLTGRSDTPWYPAVMRLFRQPAAGGWQPVITQLTDCLHDWTLPG